MDKHVYRKGEYMAQKKQQQQPFVFHINPKQATDTPHTITVPREEQADFIMFVLTHANIDVKPTRNKTHETSAYVEPALLHRLIDYTNTDPADKQAQDAAWDAFMDEVL